MYRTKYTLFSECKLEIAILILHLIILLICDKGGQITASGLNNNHNMHNSIEVGSAADVEESTALNTAVSSNFCLGPNESNEESVKKRVPISKYLMCPHSSRDKRSNSKQKSKILQSNKKKTTVSYRKLTKLRSPLDETETFDDHRKKHQILSEGLPLPIKSR